MTTNGLTSLAYKAFTMRGAEPPREREGSGGAGAGPVGASPPKLPHPQPQLSISNKLYRGFCCVQDSVPGN